MPVTNGVGHSDATAEKQFGLAALLRQHLSIVNEIRKKGSWIDPIYRYIDANAGTGRNQKECCEGSPIIFMRTADEIKLPYHAYLIEIDSDNCAELSRTIGFRNSHTVVPGDNAMEVPYIVNTISPQSYGLLYTDPNGIANFDMLAQVSHHQNMKRVDILIRCPATAIKRAHYLTNRKLTDYLAHINKKYWIVKEPYGAWQWTFLLGTNWRGMNAMGSLGFHYSDTLEGDAILEKLTLTYQERMERCQGKLFETTEPCYQTYDEYLRHPKFQAARAAAFERSGGICEICHQRSVTEAHHVVYPGWGDFDMPANLQAVCHQCHCKIHDKED